MLSVRNMLAESSQKNESEGYSKPSALDISFILCPPESEHNTSINQLETCSYSTNKSPTNEGCYLDMTWEEQQQPQSSIINHSPQLNNNTNSNNDNSGSSYSIKVSPPPPLPPHSPSSSMLRDNILYRQRSPRQRHIESKQIERELLHDTRRNSSSSCSSSYSSSKNASGDDEDDYVVGMKAKRRRASSKQLEVLNKVFERTFFPSTQLRAELGRQLGMNPRTVQIWFQNRRQAIRTKERSKEKSDLAASE